MKRASLVVFALAGALLVAGTVVVSKALEGSGVVAANPYDN